jgi:hypothetical protein
MHYSPPYKVTSLTKNNPLLGPYSRTMSKAIWWSYGRGVFLMSEVPLYGSPPETCHRPSHSHTPSLTLTHSLSPSHSHSHSLTHPH